MEHSSLKAESGKKVNELESDIRQLQHSLVITIANHKIVNFKG